jgi:hypothetical protein
VRMRVRPPVLTRRNVRAVKVTGTPRRTSYSSNDTDTLQNVRQE